MSSFVHVLGEFDRFALDQSQALHWAPLTALFVIASAWWVKGLVFIAVGALGDVRSRRWFPATAAGTALAVGLASALVAVVKDLVDRVRPAVADPSLAALVPTPDSPSFPSGHACTAFAAAAAVGAFHPRLRWPLFGLAALVAFSRAYLGVHYFLDVVVGAALGTALGLGVAWAVRRVAHRLQARVAP